jgi:hypothetical protein
MEPQSPSARREHLHRRAWQLLPWYANGTLGEAERRTVEEHLAACPACRGELAVCRDLARAIDGLGEVAPSPHPVQLARLMARIDAGETRPEDLAEDAAPRALGRRGRALLAATPRPVRTLLAAQLGAIALLGVVLALLGAPSRSADAGRGSRAGGAPPVYRTLSEAPPPAGAPGRQIRLVFADGATVAAIHEILAGVGGQIVAGPSPLGTYTIEVPGGRGADPLEVVLAHLRARREVSFATAVAGAEPSR